MSTQPLVNGSTNSRTITTQPQTLSDLLIFIVDTVEATHSQLQFDRDSMQSFRDSMTNALSQNLSITEILKVIDHRVQCHNDSLFSDSSKPSLFRKLYHRIITSKLFQEICAINIKLERNQKDELHALILNEYINSRTKTQRKEEEEEWEQYTVSTAPENFGQSLNEIAVYFKNEYAVHYNQYELLFLNDLNLTQSTDFQNGYLLLLSADNQCIDRHCGWNEIYKNGIPSICALTVTLLMSNGLRNKERNDVFDGERLRLYLDEYAMKINEYEGFLKPHRPFLCFYCNKSLKTGKGLKQHLTTFHPLYYGHVDCIEYICYLMIIKMVYSIHREREWNPDRVLMEYANGMMVISKHFTLDSNPLNPAKNRFSELQSLIETVKGILSRHCFEESETEDDGEGEESESISLSDDYQIAPLLPMETRRAMMSAYYIASKLDAYFKRYHFCTEANNDWIPILENVYIVGGAVRDYLRGSAVHDLDVVVDTLRLQKLQKQHLLQFHQQRCHDRGRGGYHFERGTYRWDARKHEKWRQCKCLWFLQFQRFVVKHSHFTSHHGANQEVDWIFNARILSRILCNEIRNEMKEQNKSQHALSVFIDKRNVIKIRIQSHIIIGGVDLYGQCIDIVDASKHSSDLRVNKKRKMSPLREYHQRCPDDIRCDNRWFHYSQNEGRWIQRVRRDVINDPRFRIFGSSLMDDVVNRDFTVNALLLSMDRMLTKEGALCWDRNDVIDYVGGLEDVENGVIRIAPQSTVHQILTASPIRILRAIKYCLNLEEGIDSNDGIEEELKRGIKEHGHLLETISYSVIQHIFASIIESNSKNQEEIKRMLMMMEELNLNDILSRIIVDEAAFCRNFLNVISTLDLDVEALFEHYGYPTVLSVEDECIPRALKQKLQNQEEMKRIGDSACHLVEALSVIQYLLCRFDDN